jgi:TusA-related sulfurtransferase
MSDAPVLDLRGTRCPLNYVKARLRLETMAEGEVLELWLDLGEPQVQVPRSLRMDGQEVQEIGAGSDYRIRVTRREGSALRRPGPPGQFDGEEGSATLPVGDTDAAAVGFDDGAHDRKPEPGPGGPGIA